MKYKVLIADDEAGVRALLEELLAPEYEIVTADNGERAWEILQKQGVHLALLDLRMPRLIGLEIMEKISENKLGVMVIFITADKDIQTAIKAIKMGAFDYVTKPFDNEKILVLARNALEKLDLRMQVQELRGEVESRYSFENIIGTSPEMGKVFSTMRKVTNNDSTVLITGESGTGKELVAKAIHYNSNRKNGPFVAVDCASIPDTLIENELFGHERGAFTGALIKKAGKFETADKGTIFLDEIGNLKTDIQAKLLRVLQEFEFERIGSNKKVRVDIRVIAATNADLQKKILDGSFREDLYYRLNVVNIILPPLAKRQGDTVVLTQKFLEEFNSEFNKSVKMDKASMDIFLNYTWPGNVRELRNTVQRLVVMNESGLITAEDLSDKFGPRANQGTLEKEIRTGMTIDDMEKVMIRETLKQAGGNLSKTARILGITRKTLHNKLDRYPELRPSKE